MEWGLVLILLLPKVVLEGSRGGCLVGGIAIEIESIGLTLVGTRSEVNVWHLGKWWKLLEYSLVAASLSNWSVSSACGLEGTAHSVVKNCLITHCDQVPGCQSGILLAGPCWQWHQVDSASHQ